MDNCRSRDRGGLYVFVAARDPVYATSSIVLIGIFANAELGFPVLTLFIWANWLFL
jgi:hypothetical protein